MRTFLDDLRFGLRLLLSRPGLTVIAVVTLALGIAVTTAMFAILDGMYWKALPGVTRANDLVAFETEAPDGSLVLSSWLDFRKIRDQLRPRAEVAAYHGSTFQVGLAGEAKPVRGELVSGNYFGVLGVKPALGRVFTAEEFSDTPGAHPMVVISHGLWTREFGANNNVVGQTLRVNRHELTVIGVAAPTYAGTVAGKPTDIWAPFTMGVMLGAIEKETFQDSTLRNVLLIARPGAGVGTGELSGQAAAAAQSLATADPGGHRGVGLIVEPLWRARLQGRSEFLRPMLLLMAVSALILLIVCANVANLLLARSVGRLREFGLRFALGAGRWRVARQTMTETLLLAAAGAAIGVPLAMWMTDSATLLLPRLARAGTTPIEIDVRIAGFAIAACLAATFLASAAPVFFVLRSDVAMTLREGGRSSSAGNRSRRLRGALVIAEVALALVVLIGAGLFLQSYRNGAMIDPGFDRSGVLVANFAMASGGYTVDELERFCIRLRERLEPAAGVAAVSYADYAPMWASDGPYTAARPEGFVPRSPEDVKVHRTSVSPGYFGLLKIPVLEGRDFTEQDDRLAPMAMVVDQAFARRFYAGASPVGRRVQVWKKWFTIVGMVRDSKYFSFTEGEQPHFYLAFRQSYQLGQNLVFFVRAKGDPESVVATLRGEAASIDPNAVAFSAASLEEHAAVRLLPLKLAAGLLATLGVIAFLLAAVGLYGVMSYGVSERTQEMGIRMALGARPGEVLRMVLRQGLWLTAAGVAIGLAIAAGSMRMLASLLVGVGPVDPVTFVAASLFLVAVAAVASVLPAYRATRVDPGMALRSE